MTEPKYNGLMDCDSFCVSIPAGGSHEDAVLLINRASDPGYLQSSMPLDALDRKSRYIATQICAYLTMHAAISENLNRLYRDLRSSYNQGMRNLYRSAQAEWAAKT